MWYIVVIEPEILELLVGLSVYNTPGNFFDPDSDTICIGYVDTHSALKDGTLYCKNMNFVKKEKLCDYLSFILVKNQYILKVFKLHISLDLGALWSKDCWGGL